MTCVPPASLLGPAWTRTEALMAQYLSSDIELLDRTNRSLLAHGGKKLRPMLCLLSARAAGGECTEDSAHYAAAMELLHNATLLHDDVVDGSPLRRGRPTINALLGGTASVLLGDSWLVKALDSILDAPGESSGQVLRLFSWTLSELAAGEILQLQMALSGNTGEKEYFRIIGAKTGSLFETAVVSGALSVGASAPVVDALREYARNLGLAFQVRDDLLDVAGTEDTAGKPVGADLLEQKITLPLLGAFLSAGPEEEGRIRKMIPGVADHPEQVAEIVAFIRAHDGVAYAARRLEGLIDAARAALEPLPESEARGWLLSVAEELKWNRI